MWPTYSYRRNLSLLELPSDCSLTCSSGWQRPTERGERMAQKSTVSDLWSCCLDYLRIRGAVLGWTTDTAAARRRSNLSGLAVHSLPLRE
uniref:Uncharacterized protein n=1 Tax=Salix viminalis TaxID=40686 RepID=A0A6N2L4H6_SALVM